ncbi:MAG: hypothetical protein BVN33_18015 [Proteobacteria bacterium ST_bin13]|nr:MAG: hypothetical protein BVN33_18015 [Proteobacteria bacterium ST_bin13]
MANTAADSWTGVDGVAFHDCLCLKLRMSARQVTAIYDEYLSPAGLRITQFGLLAHLVEQAGSMGVAELAAALRMDPTTLNRNLKPLEREGLLRVAQAQNDRRAKAISLTAAGADLLGRAAPLWKAAHERVTQTLGSKTAVDLAVNLDRGLESLGQVQPSGLNSDG